MSYDFRSNGRHAKTGLCIPKPTNLTILITCRSRLDHVEFFGHSNGTSKTLLINTPAKFRFLLKWQTNGNINYVYILSAEARASLSTRCSTAAEDKSIEIHHHFLLTCKPLISLDVQPLSSHPTRATSEHKNGAVPPISCVNKFDCKFRYIYICIYPHTYLHIYIYMG